MSFHLSLSLWIRTTMEIRVSHSLLFVEDELFLLLLHLLRSKVFFYVLLGSKVNCWTSTSPSYLSNSDVTSNNWKLIQDFKSSENSFHLSHCKLTYILCLTVFLLMSSLNQQNLIHCSFFLSLYPFH